MAAINIRLDIQYDGGEFCGWQKQVNAPTVQEEIEKAIAKLTKQEIKINGAGRTDSGVHAFGQVANFHIDHNIRAEKYRDGLNHFLPRSIHISSAEIVDDSFHARKSAIWRNYRYRIGIEKSALHYKYRWEYIYKLNIDRMNKISEFIIGQNDFSAFCVISSLKENNDCTIIKSLWTEKDDELIFEIRANRFLHTMVRSLIGTMVEAGRENDYLTLNQFEDILHSCDHKKLKTVAPAHGLYLVSVGY